MTAFDYVANCWYPVCYSTEVRPGELYGHKVADRPIVVWRGKNGEAVSFDDRCCHKRFPISKSRMLESGAVECAYHGLCYDDSGKCIAIPSQPDGPIPPQARLRGIPCREQDGVIWVWPGDADAANGTNPPRTPEVVSDELATVGLEEPLHVPANYLLLIENLLDITHFYPLHDGNIGDKENSLIPVQLDEGESEGYRYVKTTREVQHYKQPPFLREWFLYDEVDRIHTHCMVSPGLTRVVMRVAPHGELGTSAERGYTLLHLHFPVDAANLVWRWHVSCGKDHTPLSDPNTPTAHKVAEMFPDVVAQDQWALERQQRMMEYPDDDYNELFLKTDKALRRARQILTGMRRAELKAAEEKKATKRKSA